MGLILLDNPSTHIVPVKRNPLPPFDSSAPPSYLPVFNTLPQNQKFPTKPTKNWPIANWWSVEVPGLPFIPGFSSSEHPEMLMSYGLPLYPSKWYIPSLIAHAKRGYSHFMLHYGVARDDAGWSLDQFIDLCKLVKQYIPFLHVMMYGKNEQYRDSSWSDANGIRSVIEPLLYRLIGVADVVAMFEEDAWNKPGDNFDSILNGISAITKPNNIDHWVHFTTYVTSWQRDGQTRGEWWNSMRGVLEGLLFQGNVNWDIGFRQSVLQTTINKPSAMPSFADGTHKFCACEMDGMSIFDPSFSEDKSDLHGFEYLCTPGVVAVNGVCGGLRLPNGDPVLKRLW